MYAVGVDVSNGKSSVTVLKSKREVIMPPFDVTHTADGLSALVEKLSALDGEVRIVMEHTGRYYESIAAVLHKKVSGAGIRAFSFPSPLPDGPLSRCGGGPRQRPAPVLRAAVMGVQGWATDTHSAPLCSRKDACLGLTYCT